jgi:hypothetical protein
MMETVSGMDASMTTVEGLDPDTEYDVQVSATNGAGAGVLSTATQVAVVQGIFIK